MSIHSSCRAPPSFPFQVILPEGSYSLASTTPVPVSQISEVRQTQRTKTPGLASISSEVNLEQFEWLEQTENSILSRDSSVKGQAYAHPIKSGRLLHGLCVHTRIDRRVEYGGDVCCCPSLHLMNTNKRQQGSVWSHNMCLQPNENFCYFQNPQNRTIACVEPYILSEIVKGASTYSMA